jgi:hypothetical protein
MEHLAVPLRILAIVGGILVGAVAIWAVKNDWKTPGLDINVAKLLLGLMALGCVIVILSSTGVIGWQTHEVLH